MTAARDHVQTAEELLGQAERILAVQLDYRRTLPGHVFDADEAVFVQTLTSIAHGHTALAAAAALRQLVGLVKLDTAAAAALHQLVELAAPTTGQTEDGRGVTR